MDPNAALANLREAVDAYNLDNDMDAMERVVEHFEALDDWLAKGGFLPTAWHRDASER